MTASSNLDKIALEALEKLASNIILHRGTHEHDVRDFDVTLDLWDLFGRL